MMNATVKSNGSDIDPRVNAAADLVTQTAQATANAIKAAQLVGGKKWYTSKAVIGSTVASVAVTILPTVLDLTRTAPGQAQAITSAVVLGGSLLALIGRLTAKSALH
jgi:hypothetical protein